MDVLGLGTRPLDLPPLPSLGLNWAGAKMPAYKLGSAMFGTWASARPR
ncbi:hypothetical protein P3T35_004828 [Kitasatospora sp. GP30]|nr:hypothetical protein [Kitasatospora sp. GP30]